MADKVFRDPLYNYIAIDRDRDGWLLRLIDTPEVQRLRRIHQLGLSFLTYPGSDHSRFSHTLGVMHLMQEALRHLAMRGFEDAQTETARIPLLAAAVLHDIGHGPFSHQLESCLGRDHEAWSCAIIRSAESGVNAELRKVAHWLPETVAALIEDGNHRAPAWQKHLLSSELDVDRLDYLRRDSLFTGAGYGHYDWYRLLNTFTLHGAPDQGRDLVWTAKATDAIEEYIFARFYMYEHVYMHKTTRGFGRMLEAMWTYARAQHASGARLDLLAPVGAMFEAAEPTIHQFLALEEFTVMAQIQAWTTGADRGLSDLARRVLDRKRFVAIAAPRPANPLDDALAEWETALKQLVERLGYRPACLYVLRDEYPVTIYSPYKPEKEQDQQVARNAIRVLDPASGQPVEISCVLPRLRAVTELPGQRTRFYVPKEIEREVLNLRQRFGA